ncbi:alcohol dehydrogenase catalytic domain-containing protein [Blautia schinkii]|nr:alcohol dehydrogenase catalytic domain-containing protein [Blautia schinkii]
MKGSMKALRMYAPYDFRLEEVPIPEIDSDEILIKVLGCGICAGDVKTYHGGQRVWGTSPDNAYIEAPCIGGHEFYGEVAEVGKNVTLVRPGQKILAEQILPCGECRFCREGNYWMCQPHHIYGFKEDAQGGFAEYMKFGKNSVVHVLPDDITPEQATLVEPYACGMHAVERGNIGHNDVVVISGLGAIGLAMVNAARNLAPRMLIGLDLRENRLKKAMEFGADMVLNPAEEDVTAKIMELTGGYGCDVYIEASGSSPSVTQGLNMVRNMGRYVQFGVFPKDVTADWNIIGDTKHMDIFGSHLSGHCYGAVIKGIIDGSLKTDGIISHKFPLTEWEKAFEVAEKDPDAFKVALIP